VFAYQAHRLAWFYVHGKDSTANIIPLNGVYADTRLSNLTERGRKATPPPGKTRDELIRRRREWAARTRLERSAVTRRWRHANPDKMRAGRICYYGITPAQREEMRVAQGGCCRICGKKSDDLNIDHDHETGDVRSLLCRRCNVALGHVDGMLDIAASRIEYARNKGKPTAGLLGCMG
jgi:hypothetical protein